MKRSFLYLVVLTLLAVLMLWVFAPQDSSPEKSVSDVLLLPGISDQFNDVNRVEIIAAGNVTVATMVKTNGHWQLEELGGYRADWSRLQALLAGLARAKVVEPKTDKPEYYAQLGVEDVAAENAGSVLVLINIGDQASGILVGHQATGRPGQYVRLQNAKASALVDRRLDVSTDQSEWADSTILDINASDVAEVEIVHPQGERVLVTRISADQTDFDFAGLPQGREIKNSWAVNSLGSVFAMLDMESVRSADSIDWNDAVKMRLLMFSGVEIMADMVSLGDEYLLRLQAGYPAADVIGSQPDENELSSEQQEIEKQALIDVTQKVGDINQKVTGWAYSITKQKYDALVKKPEDLLKPVQST